MNGSDVSYKTYMDCFGQAKWNGVPWLKVAPLQGESSYPTASFSMPGKKIGSPADSMRSMQRAYMRASGRDLPLFRLNVRECHPAPFECE